MEYHVNNRVVLSKHRWRDKCGFPTLLLYRMNTCILQCCVHTYYNIPLLDLLMRRHTTLSVVVRKENKIIPPTTAPKMRMVYSSVDNNESEYMFGFLVSLL